MKTNHITFFLGILSLTLLMNCTKDNVLQSAEESSNNAFSNNTKAGDDFEFNTDARMATIYALQYAKAVVNTEFKTELGSEQVPKFIEGKDALKYANIDKYPYEKEEKEFIKEILNMHGSRAVLMENVLHADGKKMGNIIYVPYPKDLEVPEFIINKNGAFLDSFFDDCRWVWIEIGEQPTGKDCYCHSQYVCDYASQHCWPCPRGWDDFNKILELYVFDPSMLEERFSERILIQDIPLGKGLLDPEIQL